jgi:hypothetical protein
MEQTMFAGVGANYPGTKIYTPNAKWIEPVNSPYFSFHVLEGDTFNANVGSKKVERTAVVLHIAVYTPVETFERTAVEMTETTSRLFSNLNFWVNASQNVNFRAASIKTSSDPKTNKFRVIGTVPGVRDVTV